jgi:heme-degrading monooxygenase HmoA
MSVLMTMQIKADGARIEQEDASAMNAILDKAKQQGLISHHFYAKGDEVLVVDEWPDEESFQRFFESAPEIGDFMQRAGAAAPPEANFWRHLNTGDDYPG